MDDTTFHKLKLQADAYTVLVPFFTDRLSIDENVQLMLVVLYREIDKDIFETLFEYTKIFHPDKCTKMMSNRIIAATAVWLSGALCWNYPVSRAKQLDIAAVTRVSTTSIKKMKNKIMEQKTLHFYTMVYKGDLQQ